MAEIKAAQVMQLRKKSGAGIMDAKKALVASDGDMDKAMDYLRTSFICKMAYSFMMPFCRSEFRYVHEAKR